jgi:two-component system, NarL family, nitrate/nitrite response regulator NarL
MSKKIKIVFIDDHSIVRLALREVLSTDPELSIVGEGATAKDAINLTQLYQPDILLLDLKLPGGGLSSAWVISSTYPSTRIIALTSSDEEEDILEAAKAGVCAYVLKGVTGSDLITRIHKVYEGECLKAQSLIHPNPTKDKPR